MRGHREYHDCIKLPPPTNRWVCQKCWRVFRRQPDRPTCEPSHTIRKLREPKQ